LDPSPVYPTVDGRIAMKKPGDGPSLVEVLDATLGDAAVSRR
jgi:hypothetical protein